MQSGKQRNQEWDTRAWLVGILGGLAGGSVTAWADYPLVARRLNPLLHLGTAAYWISVIAGLLSVLVLPGVLSGIARRRSFLWGLLPLTLFLAAVDVEDWVENGAGRVQRGFWALLLGLGICLLGSSGPVSLFRYGRACARRKREAALVAFAAQREAAFILQEGVWPPPPGYRQ